jgi:hypothetical protein
MFSRAPLPRWASKPTDSSVQGQLIGLASLKLDDNQSTFYNSDLHPALGLDSSNWLMSTGASGANGVVGAELFSIPFRYFCGESRSISVMYHVDPTLV